VYWLLVLALVAAGIIWFMGAEYVSIVQLLVYAGSVGVLLVFTLMVTFRTKGELIKPVKMSWTALLGAAAFLALLVYAILYSPSMTRVAEPEYPSLQELGVAMFSIDGWVLPFELVSLVLTVALVAAVWWTRNARCAECEDDKEEVE
jgi:NADH:ubiquinone oxidoreductase subunit 6 (subunit J)